MKPIVLKKNEKLTMDQAKQLCLDITADQQSLEITTRGPWSIIASCRGLCVRTNFDTGERTIYGYRPLSQCRQGGYELEGRVSIAGKKYTAFTSSSLFELENGHLINVGIIFPRIKEVIE